MRFLFVAGCLLVLWTAVAGAIGDDGPDMLGFYFDTGAVDYYRFSGAFALTDVYLILTNPTMDEIAGWEAGFDVHGNALLGDVIVSGNGTRQMQGKDLRVVYGTPRPCAGPTVLATLAVLPLDEGHTCLRLFGVQSPTVPGDLPVLYLPDGSVQQVATCVFEGSDASAQLNGGVPIIGSPWPCEDLVPVPEVTWSAVKGLFR